jgi:prepilin-type N-terminal cleavage/methylation domain-containing protein
MKRNRINKGFSLAEVLMAMGILSIGMIFIAAVFPAGVQFATIATERTIAAAAADEAFAKIRLYATDPNAIGHNAAYPNKAFEPIDLAVTCNLFPMPNPMPAKWSAIEYLYPSDNNINWRDKIYSWSAIWRRELEDQTCKNVQVTVFVCRRAGLVSNYYRCSGTIPVTIQGGNPFPTPVPVEITAINGDDHIRITESVKCTLELARTFLMEGSTIVDGETGFLYRVLRHDINPEIVILDRIFSGSGIRDVWVIPPPVNGGRNPCIAVFQKVMRF